MAAAKHTIRGRHYTLGKCEVSTSEFHSVIKCDFVFGSISEVVALTESSTKPPTNVKKYIKVSNISFISLQGINVSQFSFFVCICRLTHRACCSQRCRKTDKKQYKKSAQHRAQIHDTHFLYISFCAAPCVQHLVAGVKQRRGNISISILHATLKASQTMSTNVIRFSSMSLKTSAVSKFGILEMDLSSENSDFKS